VPSRVKPYCCAWVDWGFLADWTNSPVAPRGSGSVTSRPPGMDEVVADPHLATPEVSSAP
jgi:hypothetical protein